MKESKITDKLESTDQRVVEVYQTKLDLIDDKCRKITSYYDELYKSFEKASIELNKIDCSYAFELSIWHLNTKKDLRTCLEKIDGNLTKTSHGQPDSGTIFTVTKNFTDDLSDSLLLKSVENLFNESRRKDFKRYLGHCLDNLVLLCYEIKCSFKAFGVGYWDVGRFKSKITAHLNEASRLLKDEDVTKFVEFGRFDLSGVVESMNADLTAISKDKVEIKLDE